MKDSGTAPAAERGSSRGVLTTMRRFSTTAAVALLGLCALPIARAQEVIPHAQDKPPGPALSPAEAIAQMTVPDGFTVEPFLAPTDYERLVAGIQALLVARMVAAGLSVPHDFSMARYHDVATTDAAHRAVSDQGPWCHGIADLPVAAPIST